MSQAEASQAVATPTSILINPSSQSQVQPKKRLMFRTPPHPRYLSGESSKFVYSYRKFAQSPKTLGYSQTSSSFTSQLPIPESIVNSFAVIQPVLIPLLFPLGLLSAVFQALPMALSIVPLSIVAGIAGVFIIPAMCLAGVGLSTWVLLRGLTNLLRRQSHVVQSHSERLARISAAVIVKGLGNGAALGARGAKNLKRAAEMFLMGVIGLSALITHDPNRDMGSKPAASPPKEDVKPDEGVHVTPDELPPNPPVVERSLPSSPPPTSKTSTSKAQDVFHSLLLAQGTQPTSLTSSIDRCFQAKLEGSLPPLQPLTTVSRSGSSPSPLSIPDTPCYSASSVSTPGGFTSNPLTPMTPKTSHTSYLSLSGPESHEKVQGDLEPEVQSINQGRSGKHVRIVDPESDDETTEQGGRGSSCALSAIPDSLDRLW